MSDTQCVRSRGGVTPTSNRKQIQDIGAEVARNGKVKNWNFTPQKIFGWG